MFYRLLTMNKVVYNSKNLRQSLHPDTGFPSVHVPTALQNYPFRHCNLYTVRNNGVRAVLLG